MDDVAIGRKEIMKALNVQYWGTVRDWKRNYKLPLWYLPNGKPVIFVSVTKKWMQNYFKNTNQSKGNYVETC